MIGDRRFDTEGATKSGIKTIGVEYGYGTKEELVASGVIDTVKTPMELCEIL